MELTFEWDEEKDLSNRKKHGVGFEESAKQACDLAGQGGVSDRVWLAEWRMV